MTDKQFAPTAAGGADAPITFANHEVQQCPFGAYDRLRNSAPVYQDPVTGNFVLTRYEDVRKAVISASALSSKTGLGSSRETAAKDAASLNITSVATSLCRIDQ